MKILAIIISVVLSITALALSIRGVVGQLAALSRELEAIWRRLEWLERDSDGSLSAGRVALQQRGMQIKALQRRVRRCERALYINVDGKEEDE